MFFNSIDFAVFFIVVFLLYWSVHKKIFIRNLLLLLASYVFYGWWDWRFLFLMAFSSLVDYIVGYRLFKSSKDKSRKILLGVSLCVNLGLLVYFKYTNFFIDTFVNSFQLLGKKFELSTLEIILPVGISFYTFQTLSYTLDIYYKRIEPTKDALAFFAFVSFFPQLVAGPIERASHLLPQFKKVHRFNYEQVRSGFMLMLLGLFKKMVIADRVALYVNEVYNHPSDHGGTVSAIATVLFAFQIYCDFSGYSDIAIGVGRTIGFDLMKNFDNPYFSKSITEFWRRWHISLSTWFKDYLYIPLGGSRKGKFRTYANLFTVFVVSGLWHGAAITYVIWGSLHGIIIVVEKATQEIRTKIFNYNKSFDKLLIKGFLSKILTFIIVCAAWIFFRANNFHDSQLVIKNILLKFKLEALFNGDTYLIGLKTNEFYIIFFSIILLLIFESIHRTSNTRKLISKAPLPIRWSFYLVAVFSIIIFGIYGDREIHEFIYFQF